MILKTLSWQIPLVLSLGCGMCNVTVAKQSPLAGFSEGAQVIKIQTSNDIIDELNDVVYKQIKTARSVRALNMSVLVPRNNNLKPAIVYFPGGGFTSSEYHKFIQMRLALAKAGYVVAAAEYRVVPDTFPAPIEDAKAAVRYLRAHAQDYGIDPNRIGVLGDSAGGWLSQMMGMTNGEQRFDKGDNLDQSADVQAVVSMYGISNLLNIGEGFPEQIKKVHQSVAATEALLVNGAAFRNFVGASIDSDPTKALQASPMGHLSGKKPPFLLMHGSADNLVSPIQSQQMYQALKQAHHPVQYVLVEGAAHGDATWFQEPIIKQVVDWFSQTLGAPTKSTRSVKNDPNANL